MAHIQTQAARKRYKDAGITEVEVWADKDERQCDVCGKLHQKRFPIHGAMPIPAHPRCRCTIIPVVETEEQNTQMRIDDKEASIQKVAAKSKPISNPQPALQNIDLTLQNNNANIQLDVNQQQAQTRIDEIQEISILHLNKYNASHTQHAYDITGLPKGTPPKDLYQQYEIIATEFFKAPIDGTKVDGFIGDNGVLHKINKETGIYGTLFTDNNFGSIFKLDGDIELRWQKYKNRFLRKGQNNENKQLSN